MVVGYNMDFTRRAVIDTNTVEWVESPLAGVSRRMPEREHEESGRATSAVRYTPRRIKTLETTEI